MLDNAVAENWVVHIVGPDDVIPKSSELDALRSANELNVHLERERRKYANDPNYPYCIALARPANDEEIV